MAEKRKDSKGRVLQKGEHQRADGTYHYTWLDAVKKDIMYMLKHRRNCEKKNRNYKRIF